MKTLNERVYESLLAFKKPVTLSELNAAEDLKKVPRMALGESLRGLCGELIVSYRMVSGKIYFSADPKYGETQNPSQQNLQNLSSALGGLAGLASLLGGMNGGEGSFPGFSMSDEEEIEEYSSEWDNISFEKGKRIHGEGYSICIPAGCSCVDTDEGHDAVVSYPEGVSEDDELMHMMVGKPNIQNVMAEFPQDLIGTFAELVMWQMHNTVAQGKSPIVTVGNKTKGYLLDADSNYILQLPVPSGIQTLRIDLMNQAPKTLMRRIIGEWLDTYECERDFPGAKPFNDKEYFSKEGIQKFVADVEKAAEYRIRLRQQRDEITERKLECLKAGGYKSATKFIMEERATYQAVADAQSDVLAQMLETVTYYKSLGLTEEEYFNIMWVVQAYLYGLVPMKTIDLPDGNLGAYNSPTDIAINFKQNSGAQIDVGAMPKHYEELFAFASAAIPSGENEAVYRARNSDINHAIRNAYSKNEEQYNAEFKMEGSMLAAYLGDAEHVIVPDGTAVISDTAFANCRNLKTVELPEGVTQIGYAAFENCPNLQSIKMPDSITSMFPALFGYDAFGKKKAKFIVYKDSYAEEFAKEHEIPYEVIREDNLDNVFKYEEGRRDVVAGLSVLVPDGFATSEQLSPAEKRKFKDSEGTSHLYYAAVSADADGKFAEYKNVGASFTIAGIPTEYEDAADEMNVEFILSRLNTPHKNGSYKIETLKKNKLVVAYDMGNSGIENGTPWVMYPVFVFTRKYIIPMQFFFNDHYTDRQHNYAVKQWIMGIIDEDERLEKERKRKQEEERKRKQEEEKKRKEEERKRKEEAAAAEAKRKAEHDAQYKPIAEKKRKYQYLLKGMINASLDNFVCTTEEGVPYEFTNYSTLGGGTPGDISGFSKIKSIVATWEGIVGLRTNGTCVSTDPGFTYSYINECRTWTNIKQIAAGNHHVIGLREDGTCASHRIKWNTGYGYDGQCDVSSWRDIKYITCGDSFTAGLKYDGTVVIVGETDFSRTSAAREWKDIEFIEAYSEGIIAVNKDGKVLHAGRADVSSITSAKNIIDVAVYRGKPYALLADGTLLGDGCSGIKDVVAISSGSQLYMLKQDGSIAVKGSSYSYGKKSVPNTLRLFKSYDEFIARIEAEENAALEEIRVKREKEEARKNQIYEEAVSYIGSGDIKKCKEAETLLSTISGWKDSSDKLAVLRDEITQLKAKAAEENAKKRKPVIVVCVAVLALIAVIFLFSSHNSGNSDSAGNANNNFGALVEDSTGENKGEFVAISRFAIKRVESDSVTLSLKIEAPEPTSEEIISVPNGYPIIFAEKIIENGEIKYVALKGDKVIKCLDGYVLLKSNYREEADQNYGLYGERNDAYSIYAYNVFTDNTGVYTFRYGEQEIQVEITAPEDEEVMPFNQIDGGRFNAFINSGGDCMIHYHGFIHDAVKGATLSDDYGNVVVLTDDTICLNGDGNTCLWFGERKVKVGEKFKLTLSKEGYQSLTFTVEVLKAE